MFNTYHFTAHALMSLQDPLFSAYVQAPKSFGAQVDRVHMLLTKQRLGYLLQSV